MKSISILFFAVLLFTSCKVNNTINKSVPSVASVAEVSRCTQPIKYFIRMPISEGSSENMEITMEVYPSQKIIKISGINPKNNETDRDDVEIDETLECSLNIDLTKGKQVFILSKSGKDEKGRMIIEAIDGELTMKMGNNDDSIEKMQSLGKVYKWEFITE